MHTFLHMCACSHRGQRSTLDVVQVPSTMFCETQSLTMWAPSAVQQAPGMLSPPPGSETVNVHHHIQSVYLRLSSSPPALKTFLTVINTHRIKLPVLKSCLHSQFKGTEAIHSMLLRLHLSTARSLQRQGLLRVPAVNFLCECLLLHLSGMCPEVGSLNQVCLPCLLT